MKSQKSTNGKSGNPPKIKKWHPPHHPTSKNNIAPPRQKGRVGAPWGPRGPPLSFRRGEAMLFFDFGWWGDVIFWFWMDSWTSFDFGGLFKIYIFSGMSGDIPKQTAGPHISAASHFKPKCRLAAPHHERPVSYTSSLPQLYVSSSSASHSAVARNTRVNCHAWFSFLLNSLSPNIST